jgi:hypothetical protein
VQDLLLDNRAALAHMVGDRPDLALVGTLAASPPANANAKSPASTPPRPVPVLDAASAQKKKKKNISERHGWVDDADDATDADATDADATDASDDDGGDGGGGEDAAMLDAALVSLFENPEFQAGKVTVGAKTGTTLLCLRWTIGAPVYATAPLSSDDADKYTIMPTPYLAPGGPTGGSKYVSFNVEATEDNKKLLKHETQSWFRKR